MESLAGPQNEYLATGWSYVCANLLGVFRGSTCILWSGRLGGCWPTKSSHLWIQLAAAMSGGGWRVWGFLELRSMGQGIVHEQRHILNTPSPKLYLHFTRVVYRLYVARFAVLKWAVRAYHCKFIFSMHPWERELWILEREWQRESWQNQKPCTSLRCGWAQLSKIQDLQLEEMQIPSRLNSDLDLKCNWHGHQLIHQPNSLHY